MGTLIDLFKMLVLVVTALVALLSLPFVLARIAEVGASEDGLWQSYPHSGFSPECPLHVEQ